MKKAAERAILPKEDGYVMNDIYFGEEGLTSTSANHVSAMANVMVNDLKQHINGLRLYRKYIRVIGEEETLVEERNDTLPEVIQTVERISKANALIAWLREAIKERENALNDVNNTDINTYAKRTGYDMIDRPTMPQEPRVNFQDYKPMQEILDCIGDTVQVVDIIKPIYNFKAKTPEKPDWKAQKHKVVK